MKTIDIYQKVYDSIKENIKNGGADILKKSINHCHFRDMFSLVVSGSDNGNLMRVFISGRKIKPFDIQLHNHRYGVRLTPIKGNITHHIAVKCDSNTRTSEYVYRSPLNGGNGLSYVGEVGIHCSDYKIPIGSSVCLDSRSYHTVSCSKNSMWIVEELGFDSDESNVLGVPFVLDGLYQDPSMFQINDKCQTVLIEINKILQAYNLIE